MSENSNSSPSTLSSDEMAPLQAAAAAAAAFTAASLASAPTQQGPPPQHSPDKDDPFAVEANDRDEAVDCDGEEISIGEGTAAAPPLFAIPVLHPLADKKLYESLDSVNPQHLSEEEKGTTDAQILSMNTNQCKDLCRKLPHYTKKANGLVTSKKSISMTGSKNDMISRLLSWFFKLRLQSDTVNRPTVDKTTFTEAEDARLLEIMTFNDCYSMIEGAFMSGTWQQIDAADASCVDLTWNNAIAVIYNDLNQYNFPIRHHNVNDAMYGFNSNDSNIRRRTGTTLKNRYGMIKSRATILDKNWVQSGKNDPHNITQFVNLAVPLERSAYYFWLRMNQGGRNMVMVRRHLRRLDVAADSEADLTRDPVELMQQWSGRRPAASNNTDNGGAIGEAARNIQDGQRSVSSVAKGRAGSGGGRPASVADKIGSALIQMVGTSNQDIQAMSELEQMIRRQDQDMDNIADSLDPDGKGVQQSRTFLSCKHKQYHELRLSKAHNTHRLKALREGKEVTSLPAEEEPVSDDDEAYFLQGQAEKTTAHSETVAATDPTVDAAATSV